MKTALDKVGVIDKDGVPALSDVIYRDSMANKLFDLDETMGDTTNVRGLGEASLKKFADEL